MLGVLLVVPTMGRVLFKTCDTIDLDGDAFHAAMHAVHRSLKLTAGSSLANSDAAAIARNAVPNDDSSLQWSLPGIGLT
ncbi:hypothetical protein [Nitrobacter sp.]|uniref:hypothetical protein n=1 Tax=Nitrobacter sp. TaxID=29420 RepID=UPI00399D6F54